MDPRHRKVVAIRMALAGYAGSAISAGLSAALMAHLLAPSSGLIAFFRYATPSLFVLAVFATLVAEDYRPLQILLLLTLLLWLSQFLSASATVQTGGRACYAVLTLAYVLYQLADHGTSLDGTAGAPPH